jgi:hypothetical protein
MNPHNKAEYPWVLGSTVLEYFRIDRRSSVIDTQDGQAWPEVSSGNCGEIIHTNKDVVFIAEAVESILSTVVCIQPF